MVRAPASLTASWDIPMGDALLGDDTQTPAAPRAEAAGQF